LFFLIFSKPNIDRFQQAVSASIINNSAVGNYFPPKRGAKDKSTEGAYNLVNL
jgi:hypothetical protein